jgi:hypothetical protein
MLAVWHRQLIPTLALFNPRLTTANGTPKIKWDSPGVPDIEAMVKAFADATNCGLLRASLEDEKFYRGLMDLPDASPENPMGGERIPNVTDPALIARAKLADLQNREQPGDEQGSKLLPKPPFPPQQTTDAAPLVPLDVTEGATVGTANTPNTWDTTYARDTIVRKFTALQFKQFEKSQPFMVLPIVIEGSKITIALVDGKYIRQHLYQDFTEGGNDMAYDGVRVPFKMPANTVWIDFDVNSDEVMGVIGHELSERAEMCKRIQDFIKANGKRPDASEIQAIYDECHDIANGVEHDINLHPEQAADRICELMALQPKNELTYAGGFKEDEHPRGGKGKGSCN